MIDRDPIPADTLPKMRETPADGERIRKVLDKLIRAKGIEQYAFFFTTGEGIEMPDDLEEYSGNVIDPTGRIHFFWTTWDNDRGEPTFRIWEEEQPEERWLRSGEYRRARKAVGLD
jgi:hypothetical protein